MNKQECRLFRAWLCFVQSQLCLKLFSSPSHPVTTFSSVTLKLIRLHVLCLWFHCSCNDVSSLSFCCCFFSSSSASHPLPLLPLPLILVCFYLSLFFFMPFEKSWLSKQSVSVSYPLFFLIVYIFWSVKIELFFVDYVILENCEILHIMFSWSTSSEVFFCKHDINNVIKQKISSSQQNYSTAFLLIKSSSRLWGWEICSYQIFCFSSSILISKDQRVQNIQLEADAMWLLVAALLAFVL